MSYLSAEVMQDAKRHARRDYPAESCGLVVDGLYREKLNLAKPIDQHKEGDRNCDCQLCSFRISTSAYLKAGKKLEAILHSHPNGPLFPSQADMEGQIATNVPWGIIPLDDERIGDPIMWGDAYPKQPILGRQFMHGITDCYSLVRDTFALGREGMAAQGLDWPLDPIQLPEVPRDDAWWDIEGQDLYTAGIKNNGFTIIDRSDVRPGDGFLMKVRSDKFNHAGLLLTQDTIIHHLPTRLSRREPAGIWGRQAELWVRHDQSQVTDA